MARHEGVNWDLPERCGTWDEVVVAVLMDIRAKLAPLQRLECHEFLGIPRSLRRIERSLAAPRLTRGERLEESARRHRAARRRWLQRRRREAFNGAGR